jgi:hypothetical protein
VVYYPCPKRWTAWILFRAVGSQPKKSKIEFAPIGDQREIVVETKSHRSLRFVTVFRLSVHARTIFQMFAVATAITPVASPAAAQNPSDRERDGLAGRVKEIRIFTGFVDSDDGRYQEPDRRLFESAVWYNRKGKKVKEKLPWTCGNDLPSKPVYDDTGKLVERDILNGNGNGLWGKVTYTYDSNGVLAQSDEYDGKGVLYRTWTYSYQYDAYGNWIHQVLWVHDATSRVLFDANSVLRRFARYSRDLALIGSRG